MSDDMLMGDGTPRRPHPEGTRPPHMCVQCQILDHADEPAKDRLIRYQAQEIDRLSNRLLNEGDRRMLERRVTELERTIEQQNARLGRNR